MAAWQSGVRMCNPGKKELEISTPYEWAIKKAFGPVLSELGEDLKHLYAAGRDRILATATRKIDNVDDGRIPNLRVTRDVLWNGAFSDDEVCAEYFGGILASSRTDDGKDDSSIQFVDVIKSLSSKQLRLHYVIYYALNELLIREKRPINIAQSSEVQVVSIWMALTKLANVHGIKLDTDFNALWRNGLIYEYEYNYNADTSGDMSLSFAKVKPTSFGIMLYAAAHNKMDHWLEFPASDFGSFKGIEPPDIYAAGHASLKKLAGLP